MERTQQKAPVQPDGGFLTEPLVGVEPTTCSLRVSCSTSELQRRTKKIIPEPDGKRQIIRGFPHPRLALTSRSECATLLSTSLSAPPTFPAPADSLSGQCRSRYNFPIDRHSDCGCLLSALAYWNTSTSACWISGKRAQRPFSSLKTWPCLTVSP